MEPQAALALLDKGEVEVLGLLPYASNATLLTKVSLDGADAFAVYKPRRGERPLWDFSVGTLCLREYAAWLVDRALGWNFVPPTILRDGPAGYGALQLFVEESADVDPNDLLRSHPDDLRRIALFDLIVNNADRKAGHLILDINGKLWSVDHGICFHSEYKLRTVIWAFEGERITDELLADVESLRRSRELFDELATLLDPDESEALCHRLDEILGSGRYPPPGPGGRNVPWPPW